MKSILLLILHTLLIVLRLLQPGGVRKLAAENILLKQQLMVVRRKQKRASKLSVLDRLSFGFLASMIHPARLFKVCIVIKPATILKFHQALVKRKYKLLYSPKQQAKPGPKGPSEEVIKLVIEMKRRNPRFGYRRIAMQVSRAFNIEIDQYVVRRILAQFGGSKTDGDGPSWLSFFGQMKDSLWSVDLFRCESMLLKSHWVMVVMDQFTRRIVGCVVHAGTVDGKTLCCMFNKIISNNVLPIYISSDNDPLFQFHRWRANLRVLDIEEIKTVPYAPMSHSYIERLIGTIRRECLDRTLFWNETDLQNKLAKFVKYYNNSRCHWSLKGSVPKDIANNNVTVPLNIERYRWKQYCNGLFELPTAA